MPPRRSPPPTADVPAAPSRPAPARPQRRAPEAADTRTRLLDVTAALLEQLGPTGVDQLTTRAVCDAAGVTAPTLYHHFGDKDGLVRATVARAAEQYLAGKRALRTTDDPVADLRRGWDAWTAFVTAHPALVALALARPDAAPGAAAEADDLLGARVAAVARAGRLAVDAPTAAATVRAAVEGVMALVRRGEPAARVAATSALLRDAVLGAILPGLVVVALLLASAAHADPAAHTGRGQRHAGRGSSAGAPRRTPCTRPGAVVPGIEVLLADSVHLVRGRRVGLVTNHTGVDRCGRRTVDRLVATPGVQVVALFAPEHGLTGTARGGAVIRSGRDSASGVPVVSLYGERQAPTAAMLRDVDVLLYDVQDVGARAYTFVWTMALAMRAAGQAGKPVLVLDRPNPIRADRAGGGLIEPRYRTITGLYPVPIRYGLTPGELARWLVGAGHVRATVSVVPMRGYRRSQWYDETGIPWVRPSPNIRDPETALLYPGLVFVEATNLSEGRGTPRPLRAVGAEWLADAPDAARELNALGLPGVRFAATRRAVRAGEKFGGRTIPMLDVVVTDRDSLEPVAVGAHLLRVVQRRHPDRVRYQARGLEELAGSRALREALTAPGSAADTRARLDALLRAWADEAARFQRAARAYGLYPA